MKLLICMMPIVAAMAAPAEEVSPAQQLTIANNQFSAKMFNAVATKDKGKSVVMSGFSALSPLAQLGLASVGESHDEILRTIGMPNDEVTKQSFLSLNNNLRSVKGVELKVANRVYIPEGVELNETFAQMSKEVFDSDVKNVDFTKNKEAADAINGWVEDNTNKRIKDLVDPDSLGVDTRAVLVNAIYFKGKWDKKFEEVATKERDFHVSKEKTIKVPTMFKNGDFKYAESEELDAKLLELFYEGKEASMLIVLPNKIDGIEELQQKLMDPIRLARASENMYETEVDVYLPKFKIETTINLKDVLQSIGVNKLFNAKDARLDNLLKGESDLYVSEAVQKAFIEVSEEGTEAAAASAYWTDRIMGGGPLLFDANKPFYYELRHEGGTAFFNGVLQTV